MYERDIIVYLLKECGGLHPFYISRIVALLDIKHLEREGKKLTDFDYHRMPYGFYSEKIPQMLNELPVEKVRGESGSYLILKEDVPFNLPDGIRREIDEILDTVCNLSDDEINRMVIASPHYDKL